MEEKNRLGRNPGFLRDVSRFLWKSKKWYLVPVAVVVCLVGLLVLLGGTAAAPFIYSLF